VSVVSAHSDAANATSSLTACESEPRSTSAGLNNRNRRYYRRTMAAPGVTQILRKALERGRCSMLSGRN
jgi:hypothetical protein